MEKLNKLVCNYFSDKISEGKINNIVVDRITITNFDYCDVKFFKKWPGCSSTVNVSKFIAKVYLDNLNYINQRDVRLTIKTCDDIIHVYKHSTMNQIFDENAFPVVLLTQ